VLRRASPEIGPAVSESSIIDSGNEYFAPVFNRRLLRERVNRREGSTR
jgi:hypothetical protein